MADTASIYAEAGLGGSTRWGNRPAVLVVDLSRGFTDPESRLGSDLTEVVESTRRVLDVAREQQVPILFTTIAFHPSGGDAGLWPEKVPSVLDLKMGTPWVEIDSRLGRRPDEPVITKKGASAFFGTNLSAILATHRTDTVVLCGATTSGCVRATAIDLLQYGYPTLVPGECVGDRAPDPHEANLVDIEAKYADVVSLQDALAYLKEVASGPGTEAGSRPDSSRPIR